MRDWTILDNDCCVVVESTKKSYLESLDNVFSEGSLESPRTRISGVPFGSDKKLFCSAIFPMDWVVAPLAMCLRVLSPNFGAPAAADAVAVLHVLSHPSRTLASANTRI